MTQPILNFQELLSQARQGDQQALEQLVAHYEPELRISARVLLGPALRPYLDSVDLVQSIHRSVLLGLREEKFEVSSPEHLIGLALTMVRRKVARHWRKLQRQQRHDAKADTSQNLPDVLVALTPTHDDPAQVAQFKDQLHNLCDSLSDEERTIIEMRWQGHDTASIAQQLSLTPVALRVRLTRLKQRLQKIGVFDDWL
ncbi:MAG: RNA polymerase sigma factor [Gemmataceae bacterium]